MMNLQTKELTVAEVEQACLLGIVAAKSAASDMHRQVGERDACGFAWVSVHGIRSNSKIGQCLQRIGFRKAYGGGLQLWDPSKHPTQSVSVLEAGADAMAKCLQDVGLKAYSGSRLD